MEITKQLALFLDNRPGTLARVCETLKEGGVNIHAISTSDTVDHSVVRMVVDRPSKALDLFEQRGALVIEDDVLMVESDNQPGSLARIASVLGAGGVNIEYLYCATSPNDHSGLLILRVSDSAEALRLLNLANGESLAEPASSK